MMVIMKILFVNLVNCHALIVLQLQFVHHVMIQLINKDHHAPANKHIIWMPHLYVKTVLALV